MNTNTLKILILNTDISDYVDIERVSDMIFSLDYPEIASYTPAEVEITFIDPDGILNPKNPSNFFTEHTHNQDGNGASVTIDINTGTVFTGSVDTISYDPATAIARLLCRDLSYELLNTAVEDFGVSRRFRIAEESEAVRQRAIGEGEPRAHGLYPIMQAYLQASDGGNTAYESISNTLNEVDTLKNEGVLSQDNFLVSDRGLETELPLELTSAQLATYPQISLKSPYRYRNAIDIIKELLSANGIIKNNIAIDSATVEKHIGSLGRAGLDLVNTQAGFDLLGSMQGFVTDIIKSGNAFYMLYNTNRGDTINSSMLIKYTTTTRAWAIVTKFDTTKEVWKLAKSSNSFFILATDSENTGAGAIAEGSYEPAGSNSKTKILKYDTDSGMVSTVVNGASATYIPSISHRYHFSGSQGFTPLPDTEHGFEIHSTGLYYLYGHSTNRNEYGVAKLDLDTNMTSSVISVRTDGLFTSGGMNFYISGNTLRFAATWLDGVSSDLKLAEATL